MSGAGTAVQVPAEEITRVMPRWAEELLAEDNGSPWISITDVLPYVPMSRNIAYAACHRYVKRLATERRKRRMHLLPTDVIFARDNELPCHRNGRQFMISKRLLLVKLLGYLPEVSGDQP